MLPGSIRRRGDGTADSMYDTGNTAATLAVQRKDKGSGVILEARVRTRSRPPVALLYCTWYSYKTGETSAFSNLFKKHPKPRKKPS